MQTLAIQRKYQHAYMKYKLESSFRLCQAEGESKEQRQMAEAAGERQGQDIIIVTEL